MIYITRPVIESHKTVSKTEDRPLYNNFNHEGSQIKDHHLQEINSNRKKGVWAREHLEEAIIEANEAIFRGDDHFEFRIHEKTGRYMVKLVDNETDEIIREIPPEKILDLVASIWELVGILVDERG